MGLTRLIQESLRFKGVNGQLVNRLNTWPANVFNGNYSTEILRRLDLNQKTQSATTFFLRSLTSHLSKRQPCDIFDEGSNVPLTSHHLGL